MREAHRVLRRQQLRRHRLSQGAQRGRWGARAPPAWPAAAREEEARGQRGPAPGLDGEEPGTKKGN
eukprot:8066057-Pyramimonas_sp.AAC.1